jgi:hypothetical protein
LSGGGGLCARDMKEARVEKHKGDEEGQEGLQLRARRRHFVAFFCS